MDAKYISVWLRTVWVNCFAERLLRFAGFAASGLASTPRRSLEFSPHPREEIRYASRDFHRAVSRADFRRKRVKSESPSDEAPMIDISRWMAHNRNVVKFYKKG
jgi:hypothetical protein